MPRISISYFLILNKSFIVFSVYNVTKLLKAAYYAISPNHIREGFRNLLLRNKDYEISEMSKLFIDVIEIQDNIFS